MKILSKIMFVFLMVTALVSTELWTNTNHPSQAPVLAAKINGKGQPLVLSTLDIDVKIHGVIAETKMIMTFFNPHNRQLEGELYFPLPEGSTVSGYALDINGVMVDGVVVEKKKGRVVFEKIVRQGIDPGLVEWVKGNNFKTRIYPIPAKGSRTISVRYLSETHYRDRESFFILPINFKRKVDNFSLRMEVIKSLLKPGIKKGGLANFSFTRWRDSYVAETKLKNHVLDNDLIIELPGKEKQSLQLEKSPDGNYYFCIGDLDSGWVRKRKKKKNMPQSITIFWDASGSEGNNDHQREIRLLRSFFAQLNHRELSVQMIFFRHQPTKPKTFLIKGGNAEALIREIKNVDYDGGTSMGSVSALPGMKVPDFYFVFTDGNSNFGKENPGDFKSPVYVFSGSSTANHPLLRYLARKTGGIYFNLNRMDDRMILQSIGHSPYSFISASYPGGTISETYPRNPEPVQGRFILTGKLLAVKTKITLNYGIKGKILKRVPVLVEKKNAHTGQLLRTFWAQEKITDLMIFPKDNRKELVETGKQYGLVTPGTSLIVLDNLSQYLEHEIEPPGTLPDMRDQYLKQMAVKKDTREKTKKDKLNQVLHSWKKRVEWWNRSFKIVPKPLIKKKSEASHLMAPVETEEEAIVVEDVSDFGVDSGVEGGVKGGAAGGVPDAAAPAISLEQWNPSTPYLKKIKEVGVESAFSQYMEQKKYYGNSPAFYLDCSDYFFKLGKKGTGLQILSNIAEMDLENAALLRVLGHRLSQRGYLELSAKIFEKVLELKPEEPQSYRDLALLLARQEKYQRTIKLLYHVITTHWDRFQEIEVIALMELNNFIARAKEKGINTVDVDPRLIKLLDVDIRIVLTWDADLTDMDLWVIDPRGEKSFYSNKLSAIGGLMSRDFTQGYGPEEYVLKKAINGEYKIEVNYYGSSAQKLIGPVTLQVDIFTNYGRKNQQRKSITLRLKQAKDVISVGEIEL
jgi:tetratricopeptide (TPR) repeat protein